MHTLGHRSKRLSEKTTHRIGPVSGAFREQRRELGIALDRMLAGSRGNSMIGCLKKSHLEAGKTRQRL